jgi:alkaline phosphatase D
MPKRVTRTSRTTRRAFLAGAGAVLAAPRAFAQGAPAIVTSDRMRPATPSGIMTGDITDRRATLWSRTDRPSRIIVELSRDESLKNARRIVGPAALAESDFTAHVELADLWPGERVFYRAVFQDLADGKTLSQPLTGSFRAAPGRRETTTFAFSGDEAGQGWGINPEFGGYKLYESMRRMKPDFFIHSGDQIYADGPIVAEVKTDDGKVWKNLTTPEKAKVCESLREYRGAFAYNLMDEHKRRFAAEVPFLVQWDDHETRNNWYPGQQIGDPKYDVKSASLLSAYARRAMFEYNPIRFDPTDPERIYRGFDLGPSLEVLMLDERSYRGPNTPNRQAKLDGESAFLGPEQMRWLKQRLLASRATWKVIASDMPLSIVVPDLNADVPKGTFEAWANAEHGPPSGRELEIASLLSFIKANGIRNVVWVTADVHYAAAYRYTPEKAAFTDFDPFWEFVAGPINAGTFGPNEVDRSFGPEEKFMSIPRDMKQNRSPLDGYQFFGFGKIDGATEVLTMSLHGIDGKELWKVELPPEA